MKHHPVCPDCGAPVTENSAVCNVCKAELDWSNEHPVVVTAGDALSYVAIVTIIAVMAAAIMIAVVLIGLIRF